MTEGKLTKDIRPFVSVFVAVVAPMMSLDFIGMCSWQNLYAGGKAAGWPAFFSIECVDQIICKGDTKVCHCHASDTSLRMK